MATQSNPELHEQSSEIKSVPEAYIQARMRICRKAGARKFTYTPESKYFGKRKAYRHGENSRKRECAKKLYRECLKLGIEPTPVREVYSAAYDKINGRSQTEVTDLVNTSPEATTTAVKSAIENRKDNPHAE